MVLRVLKGRRAMWYDFFLFVYHVVGYFSTEVTIAIVISYTCNPFLNHFLALTYSNVFSPTRLLIYTSTHTPPHNFVFTFCHQQFLYEFSTFSCFHPPFTSPNCPSCTFFYQMIPTHFLKYNFPTHRVCIDLLLLQPLAGYYQLLFYGLHLSKYHST